MSGTSMVSLNAGYAIYAQTDLGGPSLIGGVTKQRLLTETKAGHEVSAGSYYPMIATINEQAPKAEFTCRDLDGFFSLCLPPCVAVGAAGVQLFQVKRSDGVVSMGDVHRKWTVAKGVIVPQRLTVQTNQSAEISAQVLSRSNAGAAPIAPTETAGLLGTLVDPVRYSMGPLSINGVSIDGKTSLEIDFGVKAEAIAVDGDVWVKWIDVAEYLAKIQIKSVNTALVSAAGIPLLGKAGTHADSSLYLRRRDGAGFMAGSVNIKATMDGLCYAEDVFDSTGNEKGECTLVMLCRYDGTNPPIDFSLSQALPS